MTTTSHITTSGGLISTAFIENIRQAKTNQRGTQPDTYSLPWQEAPTLRQAQDKKSPAVLEAKIAETWEALLERWDAIATELPRMDISQVRDRWVLPLLRALDFQPVYQRSDIVLDDSEALRFNISHFGWETGSRESGRGIGEHDPTPHSPLPTPPPVHIISPGAGLDARPAGATNSRSAKGKSPHDMVQLFLNVSREHRWGVVTNGLSLRLLRDYHHTYTKGYVEFDLESIFETRNFADFRALYRLTQASRFFRLVGADDSSPLSDDATEPADRWDSVPLEMFYRDSQAAGIQVGADLQKQVREAIETLGNGFLMSGSRFGIRGSERRTNPEPRTTNPQSLLEALQNDPTLCQQFYAELLHIVYRVLFLLYAEQRGMVPGSGAPLDMLYRQSYSLTALRGKAESNPASPEAYDLWEGLKVTFKMFRQGAPELGVYRYNGMLFAEDQTPLLDGVRGSGLGVRDSDHEPRIPSHEPLSCRNYELLRAIRALTLVEREGVLQRISYVDLNVEEIGGIYESLLDFAPRVTTNAETVEGRELPANTFFLDPRGTVRKTTGSYYTHPSLVNALIESALVPVLNQRIAEATSGSGFGLRRSGKITNHEPPTPNPEIELEDGERDQSGKLPRPESLADGDEVGDRDIRGDQNISAERTVRSDQPVTPSRGLDSGEYRGGIRSVHDKGLSKLSDDSPRLSDGSGDAASNQSQSGLSEKRRSAESIGADRSSGAISERAHEFSPEEKRGSGTEANLEPRTTNPETLTPAQRAAVEDAILQLKVCDPAMGSGHFLIAANNALALRLAQIRSGDDYPAERELRRARRDVLAHCIYGVDLNPMAVELCKVALWINAAVDDAPLSFLDHHLKCGNSLIGATPELLENGIPDDAFQPVTGDDPKIAAAVRKRNKKEREGQLSLWRVTVLESEADVQQWRDLNELAEDQPHLAEQRYEAYRAGPGYRNAKLVADLWTAAFFWPLTSGGSGLGISGSGKGRGSGLGISDSGKGRGSGLGISDSGKETNPEPLTTNPDFVPTEELFRQAQADPQLVPDALITGVGQLAEHHKFFHWHQEFPDVFGENNEGGFDVVLGNPPWDEVRPEEKGFFSTIAPRIALIENRSQRQKAIDALKASEPSIWYLWQQHRRDILAATKFLHHSERYLLSARGNLSTSTLFVDLARHLPKKGGWCGLIVPSGLATNKGTSDLFRDLMISRQLQSLYDFENRQGFFPEVDSRMRFSLVTLANHASADSKAQFGFFLADVSDIRDHSHVFNLTSTDIERVNPTSFTCPVFRTKISADLVTQIHSENPVISYTSGEGKAWAVQTSSMFQMSHEANLLYEDPGVNKSRLPLFEGKMVSQYNHRAANIVINPQNRARQAQSREVSIAELLDPSYLPQPRYWVYADQVNQKLSGKWEREWLMHFCAVTSPTNERTCIVSVSPRAGAGHSLFQIYPDASSIECLGLFANLNSFVLDFVLREKMGGINLSHFIFQQLPVIRRTKYNFDLLTYIVPRVLELTYTAWDLRAFADDVWAESGGSGVGGRGSGENRGSGKGIYPESPTRNNEPQTPLQQAILQQWKANRDATGGGHAGVTPPAWATNPEQPTPNPFPHPPFKWDDECRAQLRADLDGLYGHLYGLTREELAYILDTFPIVRRKDEARSGEYRTKRLVLEAYDQLQGVRIGTSEPQTP